VGTARGGAPALDPEAAYYQTVEEFFVARRGDPLFLSNADWLLIRKWRRAGIPLRIVLRGIADALDAHAHSWNRGQKIGSLAYCAREVEAAAERWRLSLAAGRGVAVDVSSTLLAFASSLETASLGPAAARLRGTLVREMRERVSAPSLAEVEAWLAKQERRVLGAIARDAGPALRSRVESETDAVLAAYHGRIPERVLQQIRQESIARRLLEAHGLPRLSLFHAGAAPEENGASG
jgi:hypothetical protein